MSEGPISIEVYVRKSFDVEAIRVTNDNMRAVAEWCAGEVKAIGGHDGRYGPYIKVDVFRPINERQTQAFVGDWVLRMGTSFKVYTDSAFKKDFEKKNGVPTQNPNQLDKDTTKKVMAAFGRKSGPR